MTWISHWSGADGEAVYDLYSGLIPLVLGSSFMWQYLKKHNCHEYGCWRLSWHPDAEGHPICKFHHPDHPKGANAKSTRP